MRLQRRTKVVPPDLLRERYLELQGKLEGCPEISGLPISSIKAPVPFISTLRYIAAQEGLATLGQLVAHAAEQGSVAYDIDRGVTLAKAVEHLLEKCGQERSSQIQREAITDSSKPVAASTFDLSEHEDLHDCFDELHDAADAAYESLVLRGQPRWALDAVIAHAARMRSFTNTPTKTSRTACLGVAIRSLHRFAETALGGRSQLMVDLGDALSLFGERDARIAGWLIGIEGPHALTLEEVGRREGITRERVRQLFKRFSSRVTYWSPPLISVALLQAALDRAGHIITEHELVSMLPHGVLADPDELRVLPALLRLQWLRGITPSRFKGIWVHSDSAKYELEELVARLRRRAHRSMNRWGALDLVAFEQLLGEDGPGLAHELVIRGRSTTHVEGWVLLSEPENSIVADRVRRIAVVTHRLPLPRLRRALKKALKGLPPDSVWLAALRRDVRGIQFLDDGTVVLPEVAEAKLSGSEALACRLIREEGGAISLRTLQRLFVKNGMSAGSAGVVFSRSPVLERITPGVHGVIGAVVDPVKIAQVKKQLRKDSARSLVGYRRSDGNLELLYKLDPALVSSTLFLVPRTELPLGDWLITTHDGHLVLKRGYVVGLHRIAKLCIEQGYRRMTVTFSPLNRTVQVSAR
jgi:hypothetical protein